MPQLDLQQKLAILADAAKYDASCASSGTSKRDSRGGKGIGSTEGMGICHAYAPDGRCISLLKILLTNACIFDCHYCINRKSSNVRRARFTAEEVVRLTLAFYRRNYIEGLFLSSGIIRSSVTRWNGSWKSPGSSARNMTSAAISSKDDPRRRAGAGPQPGPSDRTLNQLELADRERPRPLAPEKDSRRIEGRWLEMK